MQDAGKEDYLRPSEHIGLDWITWCNCFCRRKLHWRTTRMYDHMEY